MSTASTGIVNAADTAAASVVIAAHDEAAVIGRCLTTLLRGARPGELDVVVVANGCGDDTAAIAARFGPAVRVHELAVASKPAALDAGDRLALVFPRCYLDADVEVGVEAIRAVVQALAEPGAVAAAPTLELDLRHCPWAVRSYLSVWRRLPWATEQPIGSGFYALNEQGRARFATFPDTMAEDLFVRSLSEPGERRVLAEHRFVVHPPRTLSALVRVRARRAAANAADRALFAAEATSLRRLRLRALRRLAASPANWPALAVYGAVGAAVALVARRRRPGGGGAGPWVRDLTSRDPHATASPAALAERAS